MTKELNVNQCLSVTSLWPRNQCQSFWWPFRSNETQQSMQFKFVILSIIWLLETNMTRNFVTLREYSWCFNRSTANCIKLTTLLRVWTKSLKYLWRVGYLCQASQNLVLWMFNITFYQKPKNNICTDIWN